MSIPPVKWGPPPGPSQGPPPQGPPQGPPPGPPPGAGPGRPRRRRSTWVWGGLAGLLIAGLVAFNIAILVDGPSRTREMNADTEAGASRAEYNDAASFTLALDAATGAFDRAADSYWRAVPGDDGAELINGADYLAEADRAAPVLAESGAREDPRFEELYTTYADAVEAWREESQSLMDASAAVAKVFETCNPYALPVTSSARAAEKQIRGCAEDLAAVGETGYAGIDSLVADAQPHLVEWADALGANPAATAKAAGDYTATFFKRAKKAERGRDALVDPLNEAQRELVEYALDLAHEGRGGSGFSR